jgi:hypothetical protein
MPSPIGPAPSTATVSNHCGRPRSTAWMQTPRGSRRAVVTAENRSGTAKSCEGATATVAVSAPWLGGAPSITVCGQRLASARWHHSQAPQGRAGSITTRVPAAIPRSGTASRTRPATSCPGTKGALIVCAAPIPPSL